MALWTVLFFSLLSTGEALGKVCGLRHAEAVCTCMYLVMPRKINGAAYPEKKFCLFFPPTFFVEQEPTWKHAVYT